jgi:hypothetical protein
MQVACRVMCVAVVSWQGRSADRSGRGREQTEPGQLGATVHDDAVAVPAGAHTAFFVLQIRPVADGGCSAVDFRWDFRARFGRVTRAENLKT